MVDLSFILKSLQKVQDSEIESELVKINLSINNEKFSNAFACYGTSELIPQIEDANTKGMSIPEHQFNSIKWRSALIFRAYISFVYMRSQTLEKELDKLNKNSPLKPFCDFFRAGCAKNDEDTIAQHIRNSICHATFTLSSDKIKFKDRDWEAELDTTIFWKDFCGELRRFYLCAYQAKNKI